MPKVSPAVGKTLADAQKLMQATPPDYKSALDLVHQAQAVPNRTPVDDYFINQFQGQIAAHTKDDATAAASFEAVADSPLIDQDANKAALLQNAIVLSSIAGHYKRAVQYGDKLAAMGPLKYDVEGDLSIAYYNLNDMTRARDLAQKSVDGAKAAGAQPDPNVLKVLANAQPTAKTTRVRKKRH
jgi:tetratricopeptide (TPR) repeat protein